MAISPYAAWMLAQEARSLLVRLSRVRPFALIEPMVPAAALSPASQAAIEAHLAQGRRELRRRGGANCGGWSMATWHGCAVPQAATAARPRRSAASPCCA
jgi:hypothetical protein